MFRMDIILLYFIACMWF